MVLALSVVVVVTFIVFMFVSNRGNDAKMMESLCKGLDNLIKICSHKILKTCFDVEMIHQINAALLNRMMPAIDNLKVCQSYFM